MIFGIRGFQIHRERHPRKYRGIPGPNLIKLIGAYLGA